MKSAKHRTNPVTVNWVSNHAEKRAAQRGLSPHDVVYILRYGQRYHAADAVFYLLRGKDVPPSDRHKMGRLIGTALVVNKERTGLITAWRNRKNGTRNIRRKLR